MFPYTFEMPLYTIFLYKILTTLVNHLIIFWLSFHLPYLLYSSRVCTESWHFPNHLMWEGRYLLEHMWKLKGTSLQLGVVAGAHNPSTQCRGRKIAGRGQHVLHSALQTKVGYTSRACLFKRVLFVDSVTNTLFSLLYCLPEIKFVYD